MPRIPYPFFQCGTVLYNINKYNFLFCPYYSLWSRVYHLYGIGLKPVDLLLRLYKLGLILYGFDLFFTSTAPTSALPHYGFIKLSPSFVRRWVEPSRASFFCLDVGRATSFVGLRFFLISTPPIAPQIFDLKEEGDLTETVVTWFVLFSKFVLWSIVIVQSTILKCEQKFVIRMKVYELKLTSCLSQDFMNGCLVHLDRSKILMLRKKVKFYFFGSVQIFINGDVTLASYHFIVGSWMAAYPIYYVAWRSPNHQIIMRRWGPRKVTQEPQDLYWPMTGKAPVAHDPTSFV